MGNLLSAKLKDENFEIMCQRVGLSPDGIKLVKEIFQDNENMDIEEKQIFFEKWGEKWKTIPRSEKEKIIILFLNLTTLFGEP